MLGNRSSVAWLRHLWFEPHFDLDYSCLIMQFSFKPAYPLGPHSLRSCVPFGGWRGGYTPFDPP